MPTQEPMLDRHHRDPWAPGIWAIFGVGVIILVTWGALALAYTGHQGQGTTGAPVGSPASPSAAPSTSCSPAGDVLHVSANHIAFDTDCLAAPAGTVFTIVFDNKDRGIPHDVAIFTDPSATRALFTGAIIVGPKTVTYRVTALPPGTYFFHCNVHPFQMHGTFVVG